MANKFDTSEYPTNVPDILYVGEPTNDNKKELKSKINEYDCAIFFARIGDQDRFENNSFKNKRVMCFACT